MNGLATAGHFPPFGDQRFRSADDLASLLHVYDSVLDAGEPTKAGVGVSHFERRKDRDHPGHTSCFFVVRTDCSSIDFSTRRALDVAAAKGD